MRSAPSPTSALVVAIVGLGLNVAAFVVVSGRVRVLETRREFLAAEAKRIEATAAEHEAARSRRQMVETLAAQRTALETRTDGLPGTLQAVQKLLPAGVVARRASFRETPAGTEVSLQVSGDIAVVESLAQELGKAPGLGHVAVDGSRLSFVRRAP